jgi:hypothetical protein
MATSGLTARAITASDLTIRETGESSEQQIEQEAATGSGTGPTTQVKSEITHEDLLDMLAEQRHVVRQLIDHQTRPQATAELAVGPPQASLFKMRDPAPFCGGSAELERFLGQLKMNFESHRHQFPGGDPDKVQYAMGQFRTWLEHPNESQRKSKVTHWAEWANQLVLSQSASLNNWDQF